MKRIALLAFAAMAVFAGCEKKQTDLPSVPGEDAWENDVNLPVPVKFSTPRVSTKAVQQGQIDNLAGLDLGIVGVQPMLQGGESWTTGDRSTVLIDNLMVTADVQGNITFDPVIYYPMSNDHYFAFYGYYPHNAAATDTDEGYVAEFDLGDTDILYAKSEAEAYNGIMGYNAAYIRAIKKDGVEEGRMPHLQFSHLLTGLKFMAKTDPAEEIASLDNVKVTGLKIVETTTKAQLCIADKVNAGTASRSGQLTETENGEISLGTIDITPKAAGADMGTLLLMPSSTFKAYVELTVADSEPQELGPLTLSWTGSDFLAGHLYTINVVVKSPVEVDITTGLDGWITEPGGGDGPELG